PLYHTAFPTNRWKLNGLGFTFPEGVHIPANGMVILVSGDPTAFRAQHAVPGSVQIFGPWQGVLQSNGERIELQMPDSPDLDDNDNIIVPYIGVDAVRYSDRAP